MHTQWHTVTHTHSYTRTHAHTHVHRESHTSTHTHISLYHTLTVNKSSFIIIMFNLFTQDDMYTRFYIIISSMSVVYYK